MECITQECTRKAVARGMCDMHYRVVKKRGELSKYPLIQRKSGSGQITKGGYMRISVNGERILEHRYVVEKSLGRKLNPSQRVHHLDGNPLNNSLENLIVVSQSDHILKFHNNKPRVFDWNKFVPKPDGICPVCGKHAAKKSGLCRRHYFLYWKWKQRYHSSIPFKIC